MAGYTRAARQLNPAFGRNAEQKGAHAMTLPDDLRLRFQEAARATYEVIGYDVWGGEAIDDDEFVDVIRDQIGNGHNDLTDAEVETFRALPLDVKRAIILKAL